MLTLTRSILVALIILPAIALAQRPLVEGWNENKVDIIKGASTYNVPCMIRLPNGYFLSANATRRYPVIFAFHGTGEQGTDTVKVLNNGLCRNLSNNGTTSYTHEGTSKTVGSDNPVALDKNGNSREAIIIAAQRSSYSVDPAWFPGMFEDITARFRIDSSMVYLYGYSAGNWPASGIIANNTDTTYNRFITAINSSSGATQDLVWTGVRKIGERNIPFFAVTGDNNELSYKEQSMREVDSIDNASPTPNPLPIHVIMTGQGHCCFDSRAANSTTYTALGGKNLIQWFFQYANPYATTWTPANVNPVASAGTDQSITLPTSSVSLSGSGSDADGTITAQEWTKFSGPSTYTITSPTSYNTTVTGLVEGTYVFRLTVTDDDNATGTDDIQITVNPQQTGNTVQVNVYGGTNPYSNSAWNNWDVASSLTSSTFNYTTGSSSGISATLSLSQGIADNGSSYGGTMCPPEVLRYASFSTSNRTLTLNGLEAGYVYDLEFYASRANTGNSTTFTIGSEAHTVVTDNNKTTTVNFADIAPDGTNKITISMARITGATYQYLNGFKIYKHTSGGGRPNFTSPAEETRDLLSLLKMQPNPVSTRLQITFSSQARGQVQVIVYDGLGRLAQSQLFQKTSPVLQRELNTGTLSPGMYYVVVTDSDGKKWTSKFIKN